MNAVSVLAGDSWQRVKGALRLLLGRPLWPIHQTVRPRTFEEQVFERLVRSGDVVYDIGANTGLTSRFFGRLAGSGGLVVAFEPVSDAYRTLCRVIQVDVLVKAPIIMFPVGVSDAPGSHVMAMPATKNSYASMALSPEVRGLESQQEVRAESCEFVALDEFVRDKNLPLPDVVKIDVEGAELLVLKGAQSILKHHSPVLHVELFGPWERPFGYVPWDVLSILRQFGYQFLFACPDGLTAHVPTALQPFPAGFERGYNVVCFKPTIHAETVARLRDLVAGRPGILPLPPPPILNDAFVIQS